MNKKQIIRRLIQLIIILFGISFVTFILTYLAPGDPVKAMYTAAGVMPDTKVLEQTREAMGLNEPMLVQYFNWLTNCLRGDFGTSYSMNKPVAMILLSKIKPTMHLALLSLAMMLLISIPAGVGAAIRQNKFTDYLIRGISFLGLSIPNFWIGLLFLYFIAYRMGLFPIVSTGGGIQKMILPAFTLAFAMSAKYTRQVRAAILEELSQDYVTGARARGLKESTILICHIFPNAFLPLVTLIGLSFGSLLGGTAVVEVIFSYPGLGSLLVSAITAYDYPLIQAYVLWIALIYMLINLFVDLSYPFFDPRIRVK